MFWRVCCFTLTAEFTCIVFEWDILGKLIRHQSQLLKGKKYLISLSSLEDFQCPHHRGLFLIARVQQIPLGFGRLPRLWCAAVSIRRRRVWHAFHSKCWCQQLLLAYIWGEKNACNSIEVSLSVAVWSPRSSIGRISADFNQFCIEPFLNLGIRNCTVQDTRLFDHKGIKVV